MSGYRKRVGLKIKKDNEPLWILCLIIGMFFLPIGLQASGFWDWVDDPSRSDFVLLWVILSVPFSLLIGRVIYLGTR